VSRNILSKSIIRGFVIYYSNPYMGPSKNFGFSISRQLVLTAISILKMQLPQVAEKIYSSAQQLKRKRERSCE